MTSTRNSIEDIWGDRTPFHGEGQWPARADERTLEEPQQWVQSACVLCSNGCGCDIGVKDGKIVGVRGRTEDISNRGRLGPKGLHGWEANHSKDRLTAPLIRRHGRLQAASWDEAMALIAQQALQTRKDYGPGAIGFYTTGQLFLEEYYTLALIGKGGIGTPHMDGNTRLCTATAAAALRETFGCDGQPGSFDDIDVTDCILMVGHNMSATDTVLWSRVLDRRRGPNAPRLVVIDPRATVTAREADVHLVPKLGTNVAVLNGLLHLLLQGGWADHAFLQEHTVGLERLHSTVAAYPPERVEQLSGVPADALRAAARIIGESRMLVSSCLQGVYQSNQATAAAVQINNLNLVLGRLGRPGCGILQMNGQPTSQNTRETGADAHMPGFRNWQNPEHMAELARLWNVDPATIPHWQPPTHALEIFRQCETGSIRMLWIQCTNPAVSLPDLDRIRSILRRPGLFVVAQDAFMTETTQMADVVLPAAIWGEKTGTFTNADRTVHISHKAVEPPGQARSDFDIFVEFARVMDLRDRDGAPLVKWRTPEECFEAWKACSRGRLCDYTGLSYGKLTGGSGVRWPCNEGNPEGAPRLYTDLLFPTAPEVCETYGHDLVTGAMLSPTYYRALRPDGRAIIKAAEYVPPAEEPDSTYPFFLTTGRLVHHFHTRTKTARSASLAQAASDAEVEISAEDAARLQVADGDWLRLTSRRSTVEAVVRVGGVGPGQLFLPFHFGYWDNPDRSRAANELTRYGWDPVSKQPHYKYAAVSLEKIAQPSSKQPEQVALDPAGDDRGTGGNTLAGMGKELAHAAMQLRPKRQHVADYLALLVQNQQDLIEAFNEVRQRHHAEPDVESLCGLFASWSQQSHGLLEPFLQQYGKPHKSEPRSLRKGLVLPHAPTPFGLVRDLHELWMLTQDSLMSIDALSFAAASLRNEAFVQALDQIRQRSAQQRDWLHTRIHETAAQAIAVPT